MPVGQVVVGSPGSGKTTYCWGLQQFFSALGRPISIINLDPAVPDPPYDAALSIHSLISLSEVMDELSLGPNGGLLYCMEYLERNVDWLLDGLKDLSHGKGKGKERDSEYVVFDIPGQVELSTNHDSLSSILRSVEKAGWRLAAVHLTDATHIVDAGKYVSLVLLSLRAMLHLGLPHINVLSKVDLLESVSDQLELNLDFYTEVQDLSYLLPLLDRSLPARPAYRRLNRAIIDLIEDFGLVGFETLCVEDKAAMARLVGVVDKALGYHPSVSAPISPDSISYPSHRPDHDHDHYHDHGHVHHHATAEELDRFHSATTVQEQYVDFPDRYREFERERWAEEGDLVAKRATEASERQAMESARAR